MVRVCKCEPFIYVRFTTKILKNPKCICWQEICAACQSHTKGHLHSFSHSDSPQKTPTRWVTLFSDALVMGSEVAFEYRPNFAHFNALCSSTLCSKGELKWPRAIVLGRDHLLAIWMMTKGPGQMYFYTQTVAGKWIAMHSDKKVLYKS